MRSVLHLWEAHSLKWASKISKAGLDNERHFKSCCRQCRILSPGCLAHHPSNPISWFRKSGAIQILLLFNLFVSHLCSLCLLKSGNMCFENFTFHWLSWYSFPAPHASSHSHSCATPGLLCGWIQPCPGVKWSPAGTRKRGVGHYLWKVNLALRPGAVKGSVKSRRLHLIRFFLGEIIHSSKTLWWVVSP